MTFDLKASCLERQQAVAGLIKELSSDSQPILLGPWRSEVGFECLYWMPFLRWLASRVPKFAERATVLTRGGLTPLYKSIASQGLDLFLLRSVQDLRREGLYDLTVRHKGLTTKQVEETPFDTQLCSDAADAIKMPMPYHVVHPSWMYWALSPFWEEDAGLKYLGALADFTPLPRPELPKDCPLPPKYVAVKFYGRTTFPYPNLDVMSLIQQVTATVAAQCPVVVIGGDGAYDDHVDIPITGPNITTLPGNLPPAQNLLLQASVMAHATAFIGTYGGMAQLALRMGVPSVSFYYEWQGTSHAHLALSSWLSKAMKVPFVVGSLIDVSLWRQLTSVSTAVLQQAQAAQAKQPEAVTV